MSYLKKIEYEIVMEESFSVVRNCSSCGKKTYFKNTRRFRVNANGNKLDVWLIYQCERCKHIFNLTVYERQKSALVPAKEYREFLDNDEQVAEAYGRDIQFLKKNKAEVDLLNINYHIEKKEEIRTNECIQQVMVVIYNPCCLKIRPEKQIAETINLSRSQVKKYMDKKEIVIEAISSQALTIYVNNYIMVMEGISDNTKPH